MDKGVENFKQFFSQVKFENPSRLNAGMTLRFNAGTGVLTMRLGNLSLVIVSALGVFAAVLGSVSCANIGADGATGGGGHASSYSSSSGGDSSSTSSNSGGGGSSSSSSSHSGGGGSSSTSTSSNSGGGGSTSTGTVCVPGDTQSCVGPGNCAGGQKCNDAGTGYDACDCGSTTSSSSGTGGNTSTSSSGTGGATTYTVEIKVHAYAYHVWCEGGQVEAYAPDLPDNDPAVHWLEAWHSFGNDVWGAPVPSGQTPPLSWLDFDVTLVLPSTSSERLQCYLNSSGSETSGDNVRYAFSDPSQLQAGEWVNVYKNGTLVYPPEGAAAFLVQNPSPQGFAENLQVNPGP